MIIAKLKNQIELVVQVSPIKIEKRIVDAMYITPIGYSIEATHTTFQVQMMKSITQNNPSHYIVDESSSKVEYKLEKIFFETMTREQLSEWGTDDKIIYDIIAEKYQIEIDELIETDSLF